MTPGILSASYRPMKSIEPTMRDWYCVSRFQGGRLICGTVWASSPDEASMIWEERQHRSSFASDGPYEWTRPLSAHPASQYVELAILP